MGVSGAWGLLSGCPGGLVMALQVPGPGDAAGVDKACLAGPAHDPGVWKQSWGSSPA